MKKPIIGIVCIDSQRGIGCKNKLLFQIKDDFEFFKTQTTCSKKEKKNAILMGSKTFQSIGRELPNRINCVITKQYFQTCSSTTLFFPSIRECLHSLQAENEVDKIFVIGGQSIYEYFMDRLLFDEIFVTHVESISLNPPDRFFPLIPFQYYGQINRIKTIMDASFTYSFYHVGKCPFMIHCPCLTSTFISTMTDVPDIEFQYLTMLHTVLTTGNKRESRNAKTLSLFGQKMEFDISEYFPLLTTKKMFWKGIVKELLWFLRGQTNSKILENDGVNIWKGNSSKETLSKLGLMYEEGDCGPVYGFQWRNFNAAYPSKIGGVDQLQIIINEIKENPTSRRLFMSGWNPCQMQEMVLPPCHVSYQFYVREGSYLDCSMYQRSGDLFLGVPFNIASTSLLVHILSTICSLQPGKVVITIGDAHIYEEHVDAVKTQLYRIPKPLPKLSVDKKLASIDDLKEEHIHLHDYEFEAPISAKMIV